MPTAKATEVSDEKYGADGRPAQGDPKREADECRIDVKYIRNERDAGRNAGDSTDEKIERNFPGPDGRFQRGQAVVTIVSLNLRAIGISLEGGAFSGCPANLVETLLSRLLFGSGSHEPK